MIILWMLAVDTTIIKFVSCNGHKLTPIVLNAGTNSNNNLFLQKLSKQKYNLI